MLYKWKPVRSRTYNRRKMSWEDDVIHCIEKIKVKNLKVAGDRRAWKRIIEKSKTLMFEVLIS